ncbi:MAG: GntR family transcriptional regulator [Acidobacteria bacterium]|nr:GntR family transcriptional regulator [Acidobacteriota bacterium]MCW5969080.1 GntR family transcriptional regulator [Blastocatellales bacterium]
MAKKKSSADNGATPYDILVERILFGDYAPGMSLVEQDIARELRLSRTPVREALLRLKLEGLVKIIPRGGIYVEEANVQTIRDVTEVRLVLEECLLRLAVDRCPDALLDEIEEWFKRLEPVWSKLTPRQWLERDDQFHQFLYRAGGNQTLAAHLTLLRRKSVLFWSQLGERHNSLEAIIGDFRAIVAALRDRDAETCVEVIGRHVLADLDRIQRFLKPTPMKLTRFSAE